MQISFDQPQAVHPVGRIPARGVVATLGEWRRRDRSRRELASFDDHALRDLGLDRAGAAFESSKFFLRR